MIDRQRKVESWRIAAEDPRDPYRKIKEIMNDLDEKTPIAENQEINKKEQAKKNESNSHFLQKEAKETSKKNVISWVIGVSLLCAVLLCFVVKKN
jgi:hypothetical protein